MDKKEKNKYESAKKLVKADGTIAHVWEGKLHCWDGPALIYPNGKKEYHIHGIPYTLDQWKEIRKNREGLPWFKSPSTTKDTNRY